MGINVITKQTSTDLSTCDCCHEHFRKYDLTTLHLHLDRSSEGYCYYYHEPYTHDVIFGSFCKPCLKKFNPDYKE